jgi:cell division protein FtsB
MKYRNRSVWKMILTSPITLVVVLVACGFVWHGVAVIHGKVVASRTRLADAQVQLAKLQSRQADLSDEIAYLSTDDGKEAEVRSKYHAVKDGESVAVIIGAGSDENSEAASSTQVASPEPWWQKLLDLIGL